MGFLCQSSGSTQTGTSVTQQQLPPYLEDAVKDVLNKAEIATELPFQTPDLPQVAPFSQDQLDSFDATKQAATSYQPFINEASGLASLGSQGLPNTDLTPYMNPFTQSVLDPALADMAQQNEIIKDQLAGQASKAGAFGTDRYELAISEQNKNFLEEAGQLSAGLNLQNFTNAQGQAQQDAQNYLSGSSQFGSLGTQALNQGLLGAGAVGDIGALQQMLQQREYDSANQIVQNQINYPKDTTSFLASIITGQPFPTTSTNTTQQTQPPPSLLSGLTGLGLAAAGLSNFGN